MSALLIKTLRSRTFKQALIFIAIFGAAIIALFSYVYASTVSYVQYRMDHALDAELAMLQKAYATGGHSAVIDAVGRRVGDQYFADSVYLLADASFMPLAGNLQEWPSNLKNGSVTLDADRRIENPGRRQSLHVRFAMLPDGSHVLVGQEVGALGELAGKIKIALALSIALIFAIAVAASISVTRRTVGRIESINATSRAIVQSGLGGRIPLRGSHDEWDELAANLNSMLGRIEALMGEVKQFTDNVAHDLRTPLARIRGRLEKAHERRQGSQSDKVLIADTIADLDHVLGMFSSLTRISQIEASDRMGAFRTVDLAAVAREVVELFDAAAETRNVKLEARGDQTVLINGDRDLLFDAIANLVDNAIKHGRDAGRATLEIKMDDGRAVISLKDDGPGIPVNERQLVFKRFYRLERSRGTAGNGLGLSLVAAVARLHGADIELLDQGPGLEIRLSFRKT